MEHIAFAVKLCLLQAKLGRKFMIEQPVGANSWGTQLMNKLLFVKNAGKVNFDSCMFDMMSDDHHGIGHAKKRTSIITNSEALLTDMKTSVPWRTSTRHAFGVESQGLSDLHRQILRVSVHNRYEREESFGPDGRIFGKAFLRTRRS